MNARAAMFRRWIRACAGRHLVLTPFTGSRRRVRGLPAVAAAGLLLAALFTGAGVQTAQAQTMTGASPVQNLRATVNGDDVTLNWQAPAAGNPDEYEIYRKNAGDSGRGDSLTTLFELPGTTPPVTYSDTMVPSGTYIYTVVSLDFDANELGESTTAEVVTNSAPVARVQGDGGVSISGMDLVVTVTATATDADGDTLTHLWSQESGPAVTFVDTGTLPVVFTVPGTTPDNSRIVLRLTVTDPDGATDSDDFVLTVTNTPPPSENRPPTALAPDRIISIGGNDVTVTLTGSAADPDGDTVTYSWTHVSGPTVTLMNADTPSVVFTVPGTTPDGAQIVLRLTVTDPDGATGDDSLTLTVTNTPPPSGNRPPTALAPDRIISIGGSDTQVTLTGSAADPDGDTVTYSWTHVSGPTVTLMNADTPSVVFTVPGTTPDGAQIVLRLTVTDPDGATGDDSLTLTVTNPPIPNRAPVANAGVDRDVAIALGGQDVTVTVTGSATDAEGDALTYTWSHAAGPAVTFQTQDTSTPSAVVTVPGTTNDGAQIVLRLTVTDSNGGSDSDIASLRVTNPNTPPVARVQGDRIISISGMDVAVTVTATATDADGDTLTHLWSQESGPAVTFVDTGTLPVVFTVPGTTPDNSRIVLRLTVTDPNRGSDSDDFVLRVINPTHRPVTADAGPDQTVDERATTLLNGSGSSGPQGQTLTYAWTQVSPDSPRINLRPHLPHLGIYVFRAPLLHAQTAFTFRLTVSDEDPATADSTDEVVITVRNTDGSSLRPRGPLCIGRSAPMDGTCNPSALWAPRVFAVGADTGNTVLGPPAFGGTMPYTYMLTPDLPDGLTLDTATGRVTGAPTATQPATTYRMSVRDSAGASAGPVPFTIAVVAANRPVAVGEIPRQEFTPGGDPVTLDLSDYFNDMETPVFTYEITGTTLHGGGDPDTVVELTLSGAMLTIEPQMMTGGVFVTVSASDGTNSASRRLLVEILASPTRAQMLTGFAYSETTAFLGLAAPTLTAPTVTPERVPPALVIYTSGDQAVCTVDRHTGALTLVAAGQCVITATAPASGTNREGTAMFTITVVLVPIVTVTGTYTVAEDAAVGTNVGEALTAINFMAATEAAPTTWTITDGNTGGVFSITDTGQIQVAGALDFETTERYTLTVQLEQGGDTATTDVPVTVTGVDEAPMMPALADQTATVGSAFSYTFDAVTDPEGDEVTYTYTATLMDGSTPRWLMFDMNSRTFSGTPAEADLGMITVLVTATAGTLEMTAEFTITVTPSVTVAEETGMVTRTVMPEVARAITAQTVTAITQRIRQAGDPGHDTDSPRHHFTLGGQTTLAQAVAVHGQALADGTLNLSALLGNTGFVLPLNDSATGLSRLTLWGSGQYRNLSGESAAVDWEGDIISGQLGADAHLGRAWLVGLALARSHSAQDYTVTTGTTGGQGGVGEQTLTLTGVHPYLGWTSPDKRLTLWATAGYGWGEMEIASSVADLTTDAALYTVGGGGSGQLLESTLGTLRLHADVTQTRLDLDASGTQFTEQSVEARRARVGLEAAQTHALANGAQLRPGVEAGVRHDAGDGRTGTGAEVGGSLRYTHPAHGLTVEGRGRVLLGHSGDYEDWGVGGLIRLEPGAAGQGLVLRLAPAWGQSASRVAQLWTAGPPATDARGAGVNQVPQGGQVDMLLGYGVAGADAETLVTPYGRVTMGAGTTRAYRVGSRLRLREWLTLNLEGARQETARDPVEHGVLLQLGLGW